MKANPRLITFLAEHKKTGADLARDIGVSTSTVTRLLRGEVDTRKRTLDSVLRVCKELDPTVTYEDLFGDAA